MNRRFFLAVDLRQPRNFANLCSTVRQIECVVYEAVWKPTARQCAGRAGKDTKCVNRRSINRHQTPLHMHRRYKSNHSKSSSKLEEGHEPMRISLQAQKTSRFQLDESSIPLMVNARPQHFVHSGFGFHLMIS